MAGTTSKACVICGQPFAPDGRRLSCNPECQRKRARPEFCAYCGKPGVRKNRKYCSHACKGLGRSGDLKIKWERFVQRAAGCWEWTGRKYAFGHGTLQFQGRSRLAHRLAWNWKFGEIPEGLCVLHHCDNPGCVNPDHLFLGTRGDNNRDAYKKGRHTMQQEKWRAVAFGKNASANIGDGGPHNG